jgi:hypothetical protein
MAVRCGRPGESSEGESKRHDGGPLRLRGLGVVGLTYPGRSSECSLRIHLASNDLDESATSLPDDNPGGGVARHAGITETLAHVGQVALGGAQPRVDAGAPAAQLGLHLCAGPNASERVMASFDALSDQHGDSVPDDGSAQGRNEMAKAMTGPH